MVKRPPKTTETKKKSVQKTEKENVIQKPELNPFKKEKKKKKEEKEELIQEEDIIMAEEEDLISDEEEKEKETKKTKVKSRAALTQAAIEQIENPQLTGVIYVGHLPWGFEEEGLKKYFQQFGEVKRLIVPRSSQTGRSKGYAFIEFNDQETAEIAVKTMHNYILFDRVLKCNVVEDKTKYSRIFAKWNKKFKFVNKYKRYLSKQLEPKTKEEIKAKINLILEKEDKRRQKFKELGIDYSFPGFRAIVDEYRRKHKIKGSKDGMKTKKEKEKKKQIQEDEYIVKRKKSDDKPIKLKKNKQ